MSNFTDTEVYTGTYIGKSICGFITDHDYRFRLKHNGRTYELNAFVDLTDDEEKDLLIHYASESSINYYWNIIK